MERYEFYTTRYEFNMSIPKRCFFSLETPPASTQQATKFPSRPLLANYSQKQICIKTQNPPQRQPPKRPNHTYAQPPTHHSTQAPRPRESISPPSPIPPNPSNPQPPQSPPPPLRRNNAKHSLNLPHRRIPLAITPQQLQKPLQHHAAPLMQRTVVQPRGALEGALGERQARALEGVGGENVHEALEGYEADVWCVGVEGDAGAGAGGC